MKYCLVFLTLTLSFFSSSVVKATSDCRSILSMDLAYFLSFLGPNPVGNPHANAVRVKFAAYTHTAEQRVVQGTLLGLTQGHRPTILVRLDPAPEPEPDLAGRVPTIQSTPYVTEVPLDSIDFSTYSDSRMLEDTIDHVVQFHRQRKRIEFLEFNGDLKVAVRKKGWIVEVAVNESGLGFWFLDDSDLANGGALPFYWASVDSPVAWNTLRPTPDATPFAGDQDTRLIQIHPSWDQPPQNGEPVPPSRMVLTRVQRGGRFFPVLGVAHGLFPHSTHPSDPQLSKLRVVLQSIDSDGGMTHEAITLRLSDLLGPSKAVATTLIELPANGFSLQPNSNPAPLRQEDVLQAKAVLEEAQSNEWPVAIAGTLPRHAEVSEEMASHPLGEVSSHGFGAFYGQVVSVNFISAKGRPSVGLSVIIQTAPRTTQRILLTSVEALQLIAVFPTLPTLTSRAR